MSELAAAPPAQPQPPGFVAWGRMLGGMAIAAGGAALLHFAPRHIEECSAFGGVASIGGTVMAVWGFAGTLLSPRARSEDCKKAWACLCLLLTGLGTNLYFNSWDYGVPFICPELAAAVISLAVGGSISVIFAWRARRKVLQPLQVRARMLLALALGTLLAWPMIRFPIMALYVVGYWGSPAVDHFTGDTDREIQRIPAFLIGWVAEHALESPNFTSRYCALSALLHRPGAVSSETITEIIMHDPDPSIKGHAGLVLLNQDPKSALLLAKRLGANNPQTEWARSFIATCAISCSEDDFAELLCGPCRGIALLGAYQCGRGDLLLYAAQPHLRHDAMPLDEISGIISGEFYTIHSVVMNLSWRGVAKSILSHHRPAVRARLFDVCQPNGGRKIHYMPNYVSFGLEEGGLFAQGLGDKDDSVVCAAYKKFYDCFDNPGEIRAQYEPESGTPDERMRAAIPRILEKLNKFLPD